MRHILKAILSVIIMTLASCYSDTANNEEEAQHEALVQQYSEAQMDSISFYSSHHYTEGYNFQVRADSISLLAQQPEEMVNQMRIDTFPVMKGHEVVVGDIRIIPQDTIDSVWVQLATDEGRWGWIHETELLPSVVPVDPISQSIMFFSDTHIIITLIILAIIGISYVSRTIYKSNAPIVHVRDIPSFYPTLLCLIVASSASLYASVQMFAPETWRHFYYHPSLNPFKLPFILSIFISSVWAMVVIALAAIDDVRHSLPFSDAVLYLSGVVGMCAVNYMIFSITTLYYIGYPLLIVYWLFALRSYFRHSRSRYICGNCGCRMKIKGKCPECGAINE